MALSHSTPQLPRTSWISSCQPQHCHTGNAKLRRTLCCNTLLSQERSIEKAWSALHPWTGELHTWKEPHFSVRRGLLGLFLATLWYRCGSSSSVSTCTPQPFQSTLVSS